MSKIQGSDVKASGDVGDVTRLISDDQLYLSHDGIDKTLLQALIDGDVGAGVGRNYVGNYQVNANITGYNSYADTATDTPVDGTGGAPATLTIAHNTTTPLSGAGDLKCSWSGVGVIGQGFSYDLKPLDKTDRDNKLLRINFDHEVTELIMGVFLYDIDNSKMIKAYYGEEFTSLKGNHSAYFYGTGGTNYRIIFHQKETNAGAQDFYFDNITMGPADPQSFENGGASTWKSYTPTLTNLTVGGGGTVEGKYRRVGDCVEVAFAVFTGTSATLGGNFRLSLPPNLLSDPDKMVFTTGTFSSQQDVGAAHIVGVGGNKRSGIIAQAENANRNNLMFADVDGTVLVGTDFGNSGTFAGFASVPIQGWTAPSIEGVAVNSQAVVFRGLGNNDETVLGLADPVSYISIEDTRNAWSGDSFTAPEDGSYIISGHMIYTGAKLNPSVHAYINAVQSVRMESIVNTVAVVKFDGAVKLLAGDILDIRQSESAVLRSDVPNLHWLHIEKLTGSSDFILPTDTVAFKANDTSGQTANNTQSDMTWNTTAFDTHGAFDGTTYTIPVNGFYRVSAFYLSGSAVFSQNWSVRVNIFLNGVENAKNICYFHAAYTGRGMPLVTTTIECIKGDLIKIQHKSSASGSISSITPDNGFSIEKI